MTTLIPLLLTLGTLLAAGGTLTFMTITHAPDPDSLTIARRTATTGRWLTTTGLLLYLGHHQSADGLVLDALLIAVATTLASLVTKAHITQPISRATTPYRAATR